MVRSPQTTPKEPKLRRPWFQFTLLGLLLTMSVVCVAAALFSAMFSKDKPEDEIHIGVVIAACIVPMGLMIAAAGLSSLLAWRRRCKKEPPADDDGF